MDFSAAPGDLVFAVADGVVRFARQDATWGGYVVLDHDDGYTTTYTHVIPKDGIELNVTSFEKGDVIGTVSPGNDNFEPHLHFQLRNVPFHAQKINSVLVGRLPEGSACDTRERSDGTIQHDPAFPEFFIDPKTLNWEPSNP